MPDDQETKNPKGNAVSWSHDMGEGGVGEWRAAMLAYLFAVTLEFREKLFPRQPTTITLPEAARARGARGGGWAGPD